MSIGLLKLAVKINLVAGFNKQLIQMHTCMPILYLVLIIIKICVKSIIDIEFIQNLPLVFEELC